MKRKPRKAKSKKISDKPLWQLLLWLCEAVKHIGADSETAKTYARAIERKLTDQTPGD